MARGKAVPRIAENSDTERKLNFDAFRGILPVDFVEWDVNKIFAYSEKFVGEFRGG